MWCSSCQQDVPGVMSLDKAGKICCARCNNELSSGAAINTQPDEVETALDETSLEHEFVDEPEPTNESATTEEVAVTSSPSLVIDDWEFEEDLRSVERLMRSLRASGVLDNESATTHRVDGAQEAQGTHTTSVEPQPRPQKPERKSRPLVSFAAWSMLSIGLMAFACGSVLLGWSFAEGRGNLWTLGLPLTLGGQAFLLIGLLFQLESLWESNRETSSTLDELDEQLDDLRHATSLLGTTHTSHAQSFYAHMAEGASPKMMLADLKGQLDMLATKIGK